MPTLPVFAYRCLSIEVEAGGRLYSGTLDSAPTLGRSPVKSCRTMTVVSVVLLSHFCSEGAYTNRPRSGPNTQSSSATVDVPDDVAGEAGGRGVITATACGTPPRVQSKRECVLGVHEEAASPLHRLLGYKGLGTGARGKRMLSRFSAFSTHPYMLEWWTPLLVDSRRQTLRLPLRRRTPR